MSVSALNPKLLPSFRRAVDIGQHSLEPNHDGIKTSDAIIGTLLFNK